MSSPMIFVSDEVLTMTGGSVAATLPDTPKGQLVIVATARGGPITYRPNGTAATGAGGFLPDGETVTITGIRNLSSLTFWGADGTDSVHITYWAL